MQNGNKNFGEEIKYMKARSKFSRMLALALAVIMTMSVMAFPVYADDSVKELPLIKGDDINAKLSDLLTPGEDNEWEYLHSSYTYKETRKGDDKTNDLWSDVEGGEYKDVIVGSGISWFKWTIFKENVPCTALTNKEWRDKEVKVRLVGTTDAFATVKILDGRPTAAIAVNENVNITYNMDRNVMLQDIFNAAVIAEDSTLPEGYTINDFNITAPKSLDASEEAYAVSFYYKETDYWKASETVTVNVTVAKADVAINIKGNIENQDSLAIITAGAELPEGFITLTPADSSIDVWTIFAGKTNENVTIVYVDLPARYKNEALIAALDFILPLIREDGKTFTQLVNEGMTVAELKEFMNDLLAAYKWAEEHKDDKGDILGLPTGSALVAAALLKVMPDTVVTIAEQIGNLPDVLDTTTVAFGTPKHAGLYAVLVVTDNSNYNTAYAFGGVVVVPNITGNTLQWNSEMPESITLDELAEFDMTASLYSNGVVVSNAKISYKYTGSYKIFGFIKIKYNSEKVPTRAGTYTQTATCYTGDNISILPAVRSFTVVK